MVAMPVDLLRDGLVRTANEEKPERDALAAWGAAQGQTLEPPMSRPPPEGLCEMCHERAAAHLCLHCDRQVCARDVWIMLGLCRDCVTKEELHRARTAEAPAPDLDIKWIEE